VLTRSSKVLPWTRVSSDGGSRSLPFMREIGVASSASRLCRHGVQPSGLVERAHKKNIKPRRTRGSVLRSLSCWTVVCSFRHPLSFPIACS
jgi:hypothetical protein